MRLLELTEDLLLLPLALDPQRRLEQLKLIAAKREEERTRALSLWRESTQSAFQAANEKHFSGRGKITDFDSDELARAFGPWRWTITGPSMELAWDGENSVTALFDSSADPLIVRPTVYFFGNQAALDDGHGLVLTAKMDTPEFLAKSRFQINLLIWESSNRLRSRPRW